MFYQKAYILFISCFWFNIIGTFAQEQKFVDSLTHIYQQNRLKDTAKLKLLKELSFSETNDSMGLKYAEELITLSEQTGNNLFLRAGYFLKGTRKRMLGNLTEALQAYFKSAELARKTNHLKGEGESYSAIADIYALVNNPVNAKNYYNKAITILRQSKHRTQEDSINLASVLSNAGDAFLRTNNYDSALVYFNEAKTIFEKVNNTIGKAYSLGNIGMVYSKIGKNDLAEDNLQEAIDILEDNEDYYPVCVYLLSLADVYKSRGNISKALDYSSKSLQLAEKERLKEQIRDASLKLSELYEKAGNTSAALSHFKKHITYKDSINNLDVVQKMYDLRTNYEISQNQIRVDALNKEKLSERKLTMSLGVILGLAIILLFILVWNYRTKQKAYKFLNIQKLETDKQREKAEEALAELQVTQQQLIHTAKMASLGELTAGIAHEIQNPLNFVNNFSEVSVELLGDLRAGTIQKLPASEKAEADEILKNLDDNLKKISVHGKRADAIVKGMLQHSRASIGKKEPTNINTLADEYLRLSYHGLRAKDKEFNAVYTIDFDETIGEMELVPQDIGRVLMNLYNNAFYAVEKKKQAQSDFEPKVSVTIKKLGNQVRLSVKDNGIGIPQNVLDKIFQPFFTTKPTGQGTGLGLSLSYDVIKAHGGELNVETKEGEFTEFIIQLPFSITANKHQYKHHYISK